jgi:uncharacterized circularly permuted ATP-grasp superfamily protein/uncharacterized alpha-E superfamily protein
MIQPGDGDTAPGSAMSDAGWVSHDEAFSGGRARSHWRELLGALEKMGGGELARRREEIRRILREHAATLNHHEEAIEHAESLDPVPFILPAKEWTLLERGLLQRTRLLDLALADLYGPRRLIDSGVLPAEVVQANPAFLRPCDGIRPAMGSFLFLHAIDLGRAPDGRWWVLGDHTQTPAGLGWALEAREVLAQAWPGAFQGHAVRPLEPFRAFVRDALRSGWDKASGSPNVVMLADGFAGCESFDRAYLSRHLGAPQVHGEDLTVRADQLFLKSLAGLQRVHVVLRQMHDERVDPLELDPASNEGAPGLVEATRAGKTRLVNALGSGLVEAPALFAFLPGMCRYLLGEELRLASVATWWCGQPRERGYVAEHRERLALRPAFSPDESAHLLESSALANSSTAHRLVGQEQVRLSLVPVVSETGSALWPMTLRVYVCWAGDVGMVMPGGLTRVWDPAGSQGPSSRGYRLTKDTWVLAHEPVAGNGEGARAKGMAPVALASGELPSRVADNLFWLGRYLERLEDTTRLLRCALQRFPGEKGNAVPRELDVVVRLLARVDLMPLRFEAAYTLRELETESMSLIHQANRLGTLRDLGSRLRRIALVVHDRFSRDTWRVFNKLQHELTEVDVRPPAPMASAVRLLDLLVGNLAAFSGLQTENMTRGMGWSFLDLGRRLERAINMVTLSQAVVQLDAAGHDPGEPMLEVADSMITYRRRYAGAPRLPAILDVLWLDGSNPRSLMFQLDALLDQCARLPRDAAATDLLPNLDALRVGRTRLREMTLDQLAAPGAMETSGAIARVLTGVGRDLRQFSEALTRRYFTHVQTRCSSR